jgi:betaine-aldehyde dehydrogenase
VLLRASVLVRERLEGLAQLETRNAGKPMRDARDEMGIVADALEYWGGAANKIFGETVPIQDPGLDVTLREPVGVCVLITPWNFPLVIATWKIAPALACGNTIVVKPASYTPLSVLRLAEILIEAGLPPEAISVLPGPGSAVGNALVTHPRVNKVGFVGSTEVGSRIMALAPAVLADVRNDTRVAQEEIFGPVACVIPFETEEEAVRLANQTEYGLSGSIWTRDLGRAIRVAKAIRTGSSA